MVRLNCPSCGGFHWYKQIGKANGGTYECPNCGNIEQGMACAECGSGRIVSRLPLGYETRCFGCGCTKDPVFESRKP